jgi:hypothetical protein
MFGDLKAIAEVIRTSIAGFHELKTRVNRKDIVLDLLRTYFLLKGCVDEGEELLAIVVHDPISKLRAMHPDQAVRTGVEWDAKLSRQGRRLNALEGLVFGQDHLAVINPDLQRAIKTIVGDKMDRAVTLHRIGAVLLFRNIFPLHETAEDKANIIRMILGAEEDGVLDVNQIDAEIAALKRSLEGYRSVVERFVSNEELLLLSETARHDAERAATRG